MPINVPTMNGFYKVSRNTQQLFYHRANIIECFAYSYNNYIYLMVKNIFKYVNCCFSKVLLFPGNV